MLAMGDHALEEVAIHLPACTYAHLLQGRTQIPLPTPNRHLICEAGKYGVLMHAGTPSGCYQARGSYRDTCAPGLWVTTQQPSVDCLLCTACNPYDDQHPMTCTHAPSTCGDITNVQGQIICNTPTPTCAAAGASCDSSNTCCSGLVCHASGGPGAACYGPNRKLLGE